jgi:hypothetical protein
LFLGIRGIAEGFSREIFVINRKIIPQVEDQGLYVIQTRSAKFGVINPIRSFRSPGAYSPVIDEAAVKYKLNEVVRDKIEETLNALLDQEARPLCRLIPISF